MTDGKGSSLTGFAFASRFRLTKLTSAARTCLGRIRSVPSEPRTIPRRRCRTNCVINELRTVARNDSYQPIAFSTMTPSISSQVLVVWRSRRFKSRIVEVPGAGNSRTRDAGIPPRRSSTSPSVALSPKFDGRSDRTLRVFACGLINTVAIRRFLSNHLFGSGDCSAAR